jgi:TRAP-type C4-dicarboxylate transport system permease small subunit
MNFLKKLVGVVDRVIDGMALISGLLLLFMMFCICFDVILRYFFSRPFAWSIEITEYILLYVTFLGAPWLLKKEGHVKVDVILNQLGKRAQTALNIITSLLGMMVCFILMYYGAQTTLDHLARRIPVIKSLEVPKFILLAVIPFGSTFLAFQFLRRIYRSWINLRKKAFDTETQISKTGL